MKARTRRVVIELECETHLSIKDLRAVKYAEIHDKDGDCLGLLTLEEAPRVNVIRLPAAKRRGGKERSSI